MIEKFPSNPEDWNDLPHDEATWQAFLQEVLPRMRRALGRRFQLGTGWFEVDEAINSAVGTFFRRYGKGGIPDRIKTRKDLEGWFIWVAHNKFINKINKLESQQRTEENRHEPRQIDFEWVDAMMERVRTLLKTEVEVILFQAKLDGLKEEEIAAKLTEATSKTWSKYTVRWLWGIIRKRLVDQFPDGEVD